MDQQKLPGNKKNFRILWLVFHWYFPWSSFWQIPGISKGFGPGFDYCVLPEKFFFNLNAQAF